MRIFQEWTHLAEGQTLHISLGTLRLHVSRLLHEWQVSQTFENDDLKSPECALDYCVPTTSPAFRYAVGESRSPLQIIPRLAAMPVVVRPFSPVSIAPDTRVTIFCSTSLWLELALPGSGKPATHEVPVRKESETWFGPSPREGELCYAVKTHARLYLGAISRAHSRVLTCLHVENRSGRTQSIDRINLPVPMLSLFEDDRGYLCTNDVAVRLEADSSEAELKLLPRPDSQLGQMRQVSAPRQQDPVRLIKRTLSRWFQ
ncbi:MAG: hypothetical protein D6758_03485 [Gammaproteobacteria bacterium]|nr:MAG: hypothetical protein D6758_03485 [Gammaproteobacteria bacterium]